MLLYLQCIDRITSCLNAHLRPWFDPYEVYFYISPQTPKRVISLCSIFLHGFKINGVANKGHPSENKITAGWIKLQK